MYQQENEHRMRGRLFRLRRFQRVLLVALGIGGVLVLAGNLPAPGSVLLTGLGIIWSLLSLLALSILFLFL